MTTANLVFLYAAEEKNIGKAAARAFVSQQCASTHIKNLETEYGITLLNRKPSISLTPAGKILYDSLKQIWMIEKSMSEGIGEISRGRAGKITIGINPTRCRILIPLIMERFSRDFPQVELSMVFNDTYKNLQLLDLGQVDLVIGIGAQTADASAYRIIPLSRDRVYFLATRQLIDQYCPDFFEKLDEKRQTSLHTISRFPFCRNLAGSTLTNLINRHLYQEQLSLETRYNISDYDTQLALCSGHYTASFCPSMILSRVLDHNRTTTKKEALLIFPIREITEELRIDLIQHASAYQPYYVRKFIQEMQSAVNHVQTNVSLYL